MNSLNIGQEVKDEIIASVAVGKEATVSQNNITVAGWTGVGYIITDPETGAGAYRISGGGNGAKYVGFVLGFFFTASLVFLNTATVVMPLVVLGLAVNLVFLIGAIHIILTLHEMDDSDAAVAFASGFFFGIFAFLAMPSIALAEALAPLNKAMVAWFSAILAALLSW